MNRIEQVFERTRNENRAALIGYITAGDPDFETSFEILDAACGAGLDILELGIPFSDPTADGPVIQRAACRSIRAGMTLEKGIDLVRRLRQRHDLPIVLFSYYSPILAMGPRRFVAESIKAGADGLLTVDLPSERSDEIMQFADSKTPFCFIRLITPTTDPDRRKEILRRAEGFVYVVSRHGVTGPGKIDWNSLDHKIRTLRTETTTPLCIGFGISTPKDVRSAARLADGVIVGSVLQKRIEDYPQDAPKQVVELIRELHAAL